MKTIDEETLAKTLCISFVNSVFSMVSFDSTNSNFLFECRNLNLVLLRKLCLIPRGLNKITKDSLCILKCLLMGCKSLYRYFVQIQDCYICMCLYQIKLD